MVLLINPYYLCFYVSNVHIDGYIEQVCRILFMLAFKFWNDNLISISDIHVRVGAKELITKEIYQNVEGFGGYRPIVEDALHNQMATYQFVEHGLRCVVSNYMSLVDVTTEEEDSQLCWEHEISAKCILEAIDTELNADGFDIMFRGLLSKCQKYIEEVCAK